jgi:PTS system mannose-specific IIA component
MIGIVLVTHGNLARDFIAALEHVVGPQPRVMAVCIDADDDMEKRRAEILESAKVCDTGDGVIVLTDMFGGTPSNLSLAFLEEGRIEVVTGVNLPMLVKVARHKPGVGIHELAETARDYGRRNISVASDLLAEREKRDA